MRTWPKAARWTLTASFVLAVLPAQSAVGQSVAGELPATNCRPGQGPQAIDLADAVQQSLQGEPQLIIARENALEARADAIGALSPFLPSAQVGFTNERYVPNNPLSPVVVIGNTVLGGAQTKTAYGSVNLTWNLMHSGRDMAGYRGAQAGLRAASSDVEKQIHDTLTDVLQSYSELYESGVTARAAEKALAGLRALQARAEERFENGHGTTVAVGQARTAEFDGEQALNRACRDVSEKAAALAKAVGLHQPPQEELSAEAVLPLPLVESGSAGEFDDAVEANPAVASAKEKIAAARAKLRQAESAFGPSISLSVQRDYLGQNIDSFGEANRHIGPNDYWVGLSFQQPLFPLVSEGSEVSKARAEVRKAQASYDAARLEVEAKLQSALAGQREADASYSAARASYAESQKVLTLTQSLYRAGRADLDGVQHAQMDADKASADMQSMASKRAFAAWVSLGVLRPSEFTPQILHQLHLQIQAPY